MTLVKFRYITKDRDRHGNLRFYFRRPGKPKIRLRGLPGSDEFIAAYNAALAENDPSEAKVEKSFEWLCERYYKSAYFQSLEEYTKRRKRTALDDIANIAMDGRRRLGFAPYAALEKVHVRKLRDMKSETPEAANIRAKQISALFAWAIKSDLATVNPAEKVERLHGGSDGFYTWTEQDVETFESYWPAGSKARLAMSIMLYLGVRRSDAVDRQEAREQGRAFRHVSGFQGTQEGRESAYAPDFGAAARHSRCQSVGSRDLAGNGFW